MISENDKQAILNGAYAVSRSGMKCKFIGNAVNTDDYTHTFIYLNKEGLIYTLMKLNDNFKNYDSMNSDFNVIGLWQDKPEPFNLDKALAGEPVMLRDGSKAYIKYIMPSEHEELYPVHGYFFDPDEPINVMTEQWTEEGKAYIPDPNNDLDIVSMWKDPEPLSKNVTVTLPRALRKPKDKMWFISKDGIFESNYDKNIPEHIFLSRPYFNSEQDANAWFKAMLDSRGISLY